MIVSIPGVLRYATFSTIPIYLQAMQSLNYESLRCSDELYDYDNRTTINII